MQVSESREQRRMYLSYLVVPVDTHGTMGTGYGIATGQNFKHHTYIHITHDPNTVGIPIPC